MSEAMDNMLTRRSIRKYKTVSTMDRFLKTLFITTPEAKDIRSVSEG